MAENLEFDVVRQHEGDRMYMRGDTRFGTMAELGHLVPNCLRLKDKAEPPLKNKAAGTTKGRKAKTAT